MNQLQKRLVFNLMYFFTWVGYFILSRVWFLLFYAEQTIELDVITLFKTFLFGLKLDTSFAAYLSVIVFLLVTFSLWIPVDIVKKVIKFYTFPLVFAVNLLMLIDLNLYGPWGTRLDSTPLMYLNTPKEMLASVSFATLVVGIFVWLVSSLIYCYFFNKVIKIFTKDFRKGKLWSFPILLVVAGFLIVVIRGGFQTIPLNQSNVYFSKNMYANHAAINFAWNFFQSATHRGYDKENHFRSFDDTIADTIFSENKNKLRSENLEYVYDSILNTPKPNVILIIWESLTAKVIEPLGGVHNVTENFNKLSKEGILFSNFYGNGTRSDKGLVSILSGYYPQPDNSIIKMPNKSRSLPMLTKEMKKLGYKSSFYYGGDTNFGNMNTYLLNGEVDEIVDGDSFDKKDWNSKWGVHDHVLFDRFFKDLEGEQPELFFKTIFSLSSHEPFEFPDDYKFGKDSEENKFMSSHAYTDKAIGNFIAKAKRQPWWDNTLVIILADHGHPLPKHEGPFNGPKRFQIPMLWFGGALQVSDKIVSAQSSQTDLAYTLLDVLGGENTEFEWGNNIFKVSEDHFVHYIFKDGFGTLDDNGHFLYDYISKKSIIEVGQSNMKLEKLGKAITQKAYQDFVDR